VKTENNNHLACEHEMEKAKAKKVGHLRRGGGSNEEMMYFFKFFIAKIGRSDLTDFGGMESESENKRE
jgi:hypothetical protein